MDSSRILAWRPLIRSVIAKACRGNHCVDKTDLEQELLILVWEILSKWSEERGNPAAYLRRSLSRRVRFLLKKEATLRLDSLSIDVPDSRPPEDLPEPETSPVPPVPLSPLRQMYLSLSRTKSRRSASRRLGVQRIREGMNHE